MHRSHLLQIGKHSLKWQNHAELKLSWERLKCTVLFWTILNLNSTYCKIVDFFYNTPQLKTNINTIKATKLVLQILTKKIRRDKCLQRDSINNRETLMKKSTDILIFADKLQNIQIPLKIFSNRIFTPQINCFRVKIFSSFFVLQRIIFLVVFILALII